MPQKNDRADQPTALPRARIFAVVVLYRQLPDASITVATLAKALEHSHQVDCSVLLYDNGAPKESPQTAGPTTAAPPSLPPGFRYQLAASNRGMLGAYEAALELARTECRTESRTESYDWLLTLDQDTALPQDFFSAIQPGLAAAAVDARIAAIVPHLAEGDRLLSPAYVGVGRARPLPAAFSGVPMREARAFNSAALLRIAAIEDIGGFDPCFWLDHLDSWLHHQLFLHGWRMYVLGSLHLEHHFSLLNYKERVSLAHFRNFLAAESAYFDLYSSRLTGAAYSLQLAVRLLNQWRRRESAEVRRATWQSLLRRLTVGKTTRIARWREAMGCAHGVKQDTPEQRT